METGAFSLVMRGKTPSTFRQSAAGKPLRSRDERRAFFQAETLALADSLYRTAMRLAKRQSDAEDLVAEAVAKAWAAFDTLSDDTRFKPWIFRVLINSFRSQQRKRGREVSLDDCGGADAEGADEFWLFDRLCQPFLLWWSNPEQDFLTKILREDLQRALDGLPDCFGAAITLVIVEGCSYQEAADILDIPLGTVRSRVRRGRSLLQKALWAHAQEAGLDRANTKEETTNG